MAWIPVVAPHVVKLIEILMGGRPSAPPPPFDPAPLIKEFNDKLAKKDEEQKLAIERHNLERAEQLERQKQDFMIHIQALKDDQKRTEMETNELKEQLDKPIKDRRRKMEFVNGLDLRVIRTESVLLLGPKGTGKSTFLYLMGKGDKPIRTSKDGSVIITDQEKYVDTIGILGWESHNLIKLLVLLLYRGFPKDLIIFVANDRIMQSLTTIGTVGMINPMIALLSNDFWRWHNRGNIKLIKDPAGVLKVHPVEDLERIYNFDTYDMIKELSLGTAITHHDNLDVLTLKRHNAGIRPFDVILKMLGDKLIVKEADNEYLIESIFRYVYIYEKRYKGQHEGDLNFMNNCKVTEFDDME